MALSGELAAIEPLRYTPAGIPLLSFKLTHRSRQTAARADQYSIALVGYTNAGKSTLMNRLTGADVLAENRLFSTLDTRTRPWRLAGGRTVLLSDTVGFIRNLPHELVASFHATLEEALTADLLFVVADAHDPVRSLVGQEQVGHLGDEIREVEAAKIDGDELAPAHRVSQRAIDRDEMLAPQLGGGDRLEPLQVGLGE